MARVRIQVSSFRSLMTWLRPYRHSMRAGTFPNRFESKLLVTSVGKSMLLPAFGKASLPIWSTIWRSCGMQLPLRPIGSSKGETA